MAASAIILARQELRTRSAVHPAVRRRVPEVAKVLFIAALFCIALLAGLLADLDTFATAGLAVGVGIIAAVVAWPLLGIQLLLVGVPLHLLLKLYVGAELFTYWKEGLIALLAVLALINTQLWGRVRASSLFLPLAIFFGLVILRAAGAEDYTIAAWGLYEYLTYPVFMIAVVGHCQTWAHYRRLLVFTTVAGSLIGFSATLDWLYEWSVPLHEARSVHHWIDAEAGIRRAMFTFDSPMALGGFCALILSLALAASFCVIPRIGRVLSVIASLGLLAGLLISFSRGPWVQGAVTITATLYLVMFAPVKERTHRWYAMSVVGVSALAVVLVALFAASPNQDLLRQRALSMFSWQSGTGDLSNQLRLSAWRQSLNDFADNPLWGTGLSTTGSLVGTRQISNSYVTESQLLKVGVEMGLTGALAYLFLLLQAQRKAWELAKATNGVLGSRWVAVGIASALLGFFVHQFALQALEAKPVAMIFWLLVGGVVMLESATKEAKPISRSSVPSARA